MSTEYRPDRRVDHIKRLPAVTKNEAAGPTEITRERAWEKAREALADDVRKGDKPKRTFASLVKKK